MKMMAQDKKVRDGKLTFILARGIGEAFIARDVPRRQVRALPRRRDAAPLEPAANDAGSRYEPVQFDAGAAVSG